MSRARVIGIAAGVAAAGAVVFTYTNPFRTPGVKQIEQRFSAGGGTATHTPAVATKRGDEMNVASPTSKSSGISSKQFKDKVSDQRPEGDLSTKRFYESHYGNPKGG